MDESGYDELTDAILGAAIAVHQELGPGLLESAYEACLVYELRKRNLQVEQQKTLPVTYGEVQLECGYRIDLLVEEKVIVELKAVEKILPVHQAQVISYLKLSGCKIGLLLNFNEIRLKNGIRRLIV